MTLLDDLYCLCSGKMVTGQFLPIIMARGGCFSPAWLAEVEGGWWPTWCPEDGAFFFGFRFLHLPPFLLVLWILWLLVARCSPSEEEGRGIVSWDTGSEEAIGLGTTREAYEPRYFCDKVEMLLTMETLGGGLRINEGKFPISEESFNNPTPALS